MDRERLRPRDLTGAGRGPDRGQGLAEALLEEHEVYTDSRYPDAGLHKRPSLLEYTIPTSVDTPEMQAMIVESIDPEGPYGAKVAGEGPLHGSLPALANARYNATGVWFTKLPFTPARLLAGLRAAGVEAGATSAAAAGQREPSAR